VNLQMTVVNNAIYQNQIYSPEKDRIWAHISKLVRSETPLTDIQRDLLKLQFNLRMLGADNEHIQGSARRFQKFLRDSLIAQIENNQQCVIVVCDLPHIVITVDQVEIQRNTVYLATLMWQGRYTYPPEQLSPHRIAEQALKMLDWEA
jgi:hypothetical protein